MAYNPLQLGTVPDDGGGESLREACVKIDTMLAELFTALAGSATQTELTIAVSNLSSSIGDLNEALAGKASVGSLAAKAELTQVIRRDASQDITNSERLQHALNAGTLVSFAYDLIDSADTLAPGTWEIPPFPADFYLHEARLVVKDSKGGALSGALELTGAGDVLVWTGATYEDGGSSPGAIVSPPVQTVHVLPAAAALSVSLDSVSPSGSSDPSYGLVLWFRGSWAV